MEEPAGEMNESVKHNWERVGMKPNVWTHALIKAGIPFRDSFSLVKVKKTGVIENRPASARHVWMAITSASLLTKLKFKENFSIPRRLRWSWWMYVSYMCMHVPTFFFLTFSSRLSLVVKSRRRRLTYTLTTCIKVEQTRSSTFSP